MNKVIKYILIYALSLSFGEGWGEVFSQNLVPNGDFEIDTLCPNNGSQIQYAVPWNTPTWGSPDYFNSCDGSAINSFGVPLNYVGYQFAKTGVAYAGIYCYGATHITLAEGKEYLQVQLTDSLIEQRTYCVSFWVSLANPEVQQYNAVAITQIGLFISHDTVSSSDMGTLPHIPQIVSLPNQYMNDTSNWTEISGTYVAQGGEKYITIGNFTYPTDTVGMGGPQNSGFFFGAYYFIDDVSIIDCTNVGVSEETKDEEISVYPNPATNSLTLTLSHFSKLNERGEGTVAIYDVLGEIVYSSKINSLKSTIDISTFPKGVYFVRLQNDKHIINKKFVKE